MECKDSRRLQPHPLLEGHPFPYRRLVFPSGDGSGLLLRSKSSEANCFHSWVNYPDNQPRVSFPFILWSLILPPRTSMNNGHPSLMFVLGDVYHIALCHQPPSSFNAYSVGDISAPKAVKLHWW